MKPWGNKPHRAPAPFPNTFSKMAPLFAYSLWKVVHPLPGMINSQGLSLCKKEVLQLRKKHYLVRNYNVRNYRKDRRYNINGNRSVGLSTHI